MVFDKQGKFVDNLKREHFVLKVDGKPREISFFELVKAGSSGEEAQLAAARGEASSAGEPLPLDRGRVVFFFIDDLHLSAASLSRVRTLLSRFVQLEAGQNDRVAIVSASGQIGFLQQLTDNKTVLRKAIGRLSPKNRSTKDFERPAMSEYQAELIERFDQDVLEYFVEALVKDGMPRQMAEQAVRQRASAMLEQAAHFSIQSLQTLHNLARSAADLPGRKLIFFISDGFLINSRDAVRQRVRDLTAQAARAGVVIYSIDARGLVADASDVADPVQFDPSGRLQRASMGELTASQDGMHALAADTGGRALFNANDLFQSVKTGLVETSRYYLLAWRPESEDEKAKKDRSVEAFIVGRPDLLVRFRRSLPSTAVDARRKGTPSSATTSELLRAGINAEYPRTALPVQVTANFLNTADRGSLLATSIKITTSELQLEIDNGSASALIDLAIAIVDEHGKPVRSVSQTLTLSSPSKSPHTVPPESVFYNDFVPVPPGLYQVRVAAIEHKRRRVGSNHDWLEVPDLESKHLAMSTLLVAEKPAGPVSQDVSEDRSKQERTANPFDNLRLSIERRFGRDSHLRFITFVYNAANAARNSADAPAAVAGSQTALAAPDLAVQVQIFRDDQPVVTTPARKIPTEGVSDLGRVPYAAEIALDGLQTGGYLLQVTAIDRIAKTTASQRFKFQVD